MLFRSNKTDLPNANSLKVQQQLQDHGLALAGSGGMTLFADVSALTGHGKDGLLWIILIQTSFLELFANPNRRAKGNVVEAGLEPGGPVATLLVRKGTLRLGDVLVCGQYYGKVHELLSEDGQRLTEAGPSAAVKVLGLDGVPDAGMEFSAVEDEETAVATIRDSRLRACTGCGEYYDEHAPQEHVCRPRPE